MTNHAMLDNVTHKDLRINTVYEKNRGYDVNITRVFPAEFIQLQAEYPVFLLKNKETGHFDTVALLGFSEGENLFLGDRGWDARYVPLTIQRQPFLIGFQQREKDGVPVQEPVVTVDLDHPSISYSEGAPVFLEHGGESEFLQHMTSVLMTIHEGHDVGASFSQLLVGLDLIESLKLEVELRDGSKHSIGGLYTINEEKLRGLNGGALEALHKKGHLQDVYMMLASLPNVRTLIDRKDRQ